MTILCATDFSPSAKRAATVAAAIARKLGEPLRLVHSINEQTAERVLASGAEEVYQGVRRWLEEEGERVRGLGCEVQTEMLAGIPDSQIAHAAELVAARLVVVGHVGYRKASEILLGSVAERLCQVSSRPVLVVRTHAAIETWLAGTRPLRVLVATDLADRGAKALAQLADLRRLGELDVLVAHVAERGDDVPAPAEAEAELRRSVERVLGTSTGETRLRYVVETAERRADERIVDLAAREDVDLIVVGSHQRQGIARLWHTSVSRGVVQLAPTSVLLVPSPAAT